MKKITNSSARSYVQNRDEFTANNLSAKQIGDAYVVLSYGYYPIFVYVDGSWYENSSKYSRTTAKQMSQSRPNANLIVKVSTNELKELVMKHGKGKMYAKGGAVSRKERLLEILDEVTDYEDVDKNDIPSSLVDESFEKNLDDDEIETKLNNFLSRIGYEYDDDEYKWKKKMAKGGLTAHGLKMNDTIKSGGGIGKTTIRVHNSNSGDARVDLDKGKRTPLEYNRKTKMYEEKMAKGGAISVGDNVKIKGTNKTMTVKDISKGKKGYVEFSGNGGTYLIGDLEKYAKGGKMKKRQGGEAPYITAKNDRGIEETVYLTSVEDGYDVESELSDALQGEFTITDLSTELKSWLPSEKGVYYFDVDAVTAFCQALDLTYETGIEMDTLAEIYKDFQISDLEEFFRENYEGNFKNDEDFAYNYIESIGGVGELSDSDIRNYFDYASFGRDLAMDFTEYDGHYFRNT